jgi:hypothetical protein
MMIAWILIAVVLILIGASTVQLARTNRTATAVLLAGLAWSTLPWISGRRRSLRLASVTTQVAVAVALTAVLL